jgi:hypothetical protein
MAGFERKSVITPFSLDDETKADATPDKEPESVSEPRPRPSVKDTPKEKPAAKPRATTRRRTTSTPPNRVSPGWVHNALATKILQALQVKVTQETGNEFNVGNLPKNETLAKDAGIIDERQPVELLARIIAHIMYRIPGGAKIEKRLEGKDSSSGILSDISAFFTQLYTMNEDTFDAVRHNVVQQAKAKKAAPKNGGVTNVPS